MAWLVTFLVVTGMLVVVPLGLSLIDGPSWLRRWWPLAAVPGAVSLLLPRGQIAGLLATSYLVLCGVLALQAPRRLARQLTGRRRLAPGAPPGEWAGEWAVATALGAPAIAAIAMVAERTGYRLLGFRLEVLRLGEAHFYFAGFAAALIAALVCRAAASVSSRAAALAIPVGLGVVVAGFFISDWVALAGAVMLAGGMWLVGLVTWRQVWPVGAGRATTVLLGISAGVPTVTMALALSRAVGEAAGWPHPSTGWMAATHGVGNAFGFAVCGLLAWRRLRDVPL